MNEPILSPKRNVTIIQLLSEREAASIDAAFDIFSEPEVYAYTKSNANLMDDTMLADLLHVMHGHLTAQTASDSKPIFERKAFLAKLSGKEDTALRLLQRFTELHENACNQIRTHVTNRDFLQARSVLHDILGISGNLCCQRLYEAAAALRLDCIAETDTTLDTFCGIWDETLNLIQTYLMLHQTQKQAKTAKEPFAGTWNKFISLCSDCDISAADFFDENQAAFQEAFDREVFQQIEDAIRRYDLFYIAENIQYSGH